MVASENAALRGGKAGGVGDVVRDLPVALASLGWRSTVIIPAYDFLHKNNEASLFAQVVVPFRGERLTVELWDARSAHPSIRHILVHHPLITGEPIYCNDPPGQPFVRDASKYALFCSAVGVFLKSLSDTPVVHLHDWHAGILLLLRELHPEFHDLQRHNTIFTIHNLGIQGTRPMYGHESSLESWFPEVFTDDGWVDEWCDPRYEEYLYTPLLSGIRESRHVNTVSGSYAREILQPSNQANGYYGGEGMESFLQQVHSEGRLSGILNGCHYPEHQLPAVPFDEIITIIKEEAENRQVTLPGVSVERVRNLVERFSRGGKPVLLTSVTRVTEQKVRLLCEMNSEGVIALDAICRMLEESNGLYILIGSGTPEYEGALTEVSSRHERFLFVRGYSEKIGDALYRGGTMFLMPSLYEPCGISQMLAMREGQPCIVHAVGGLRDTVWHDVNGFSFEGGSIPEKVDNFIAAIRRALHCINNDPVKWDRLKAASRSARFDWVSAAKKYESLYKS